MYYISGASTISHQPTFQNDGFSDTIGALSGESELLPPNFKDYIEPGLLRRMSKVLRISVASAKDSLQQANVAQPDAIVVGTGLGCLQDTEKFLQNFLTIEGLLPPTAFIQSTHNTIAGQISLSLGNHGYNMTHTQNTVSFEHAMLDAMLLLDEHGGHVLAGAADEHITFLDTAAPKLGLDHIGPITTGASFFTLSAEPSDKTRAVIRDVRTITFPASFSESLNTFLSGLDVSSDELDLVLYSSFDETAVSEAFSGTARIRNYQELSGYYPTASAFALHYACDQVLVDPTKNRILICNWLNKDNLAFTLIERFEA